jgi:hypothetical protein
MMRIRLLASSEQCPLNKERCSYLRLLALTKAKDEQSWMIETQVSKAMMKSVFDCPQVIDLSKGALYKNYLCNITKSNAISVFHIRSSKGRKCTCRQWSNGQFPDAATCKKNGTTNPQTEDSETNINGGQIRTQARKTNRIYGPSPQTGKTTKKIEVLHRNSGT